MSLSVYVDENIPGIEQMLHESVQITCFNGRELTQQDLRRADALLVRSVTNVNEQLLRNTPVRFVGTATSGYDHVDTSYLSTAGIGYAHAPGANANSVVEYVLAAVGSCGRRLETLLSGGVMGIVGQGAVGQLLAERCTALGIQTRVYDPWLAPEQLVNPANLDEVLACDVVSLHCSLTDQSPFPSRHLLGERALALLAPGALLINASRGAVVDNAALAAFLKSTDTVKVVLDVWEAEPNISTELLYLVSLATAHIAGYSYDGKFRATRMLADALGKFYGGVDASANVTLAESAVGKGDEAARSKQSIINVDAVATDAELIRTLIDKRYSINEDDRLLREAVANSTEAARGGAFDALRRQYRTRRELWGSSVAAPALSGSQRALVDSLGCRMVTQ